MSLCRHQVIPFIWFILWWRTMFWTWPFVLLLLQWHKSLFSSNISILNEMNFTSLDFVSYSNKVILGNQESTAVFFSSIFTTGVFNTHTETHTHPLCCSTRSNLCISEAAVLMWLLAKQFVQRSQSRHCVCSDVLFGLSKPRPDAARQENPAALTARSRGHRSHLVW